MSERESLEWHLDRAKLFIDQYFEWDERQRPLLGKTSLETAIEDIAIAITKIPNVQSCKEGVNE